MLLEFFGGIALIIGFLVTFVSIPLVSMIVAILTVHYGFSSVNTIGLTPSGPVFGPPGYEINLFYTAGLLALSEPTAFSIDGLRSRINRPDSATESR